MFTFRDAFTSTALVAVVATSFTSCGPRLSPRSYFVPDLGADAKTATQEGVSITLRPIKVEIKQTEQILSLTKDTGGSWLTQAIESARDTDPYIVQLRTGIMPSPSRQDFTAIVKNNTGNVFRFRPFTIISIDGLTAQIPTPTAAAAGTTVNTPTATPSGVLAMMFTRSTGADGKTRTTTLPELAVAPGKSIEVTIAGPPLKAFSKTSGTLDVGFYEVKIGAAEAKFEYSFAYSATAGTFQPKLEQENRRYYIDEAQAIRAEASWNLNDDR